MSALQNMLKKVVTDQKQMNGQDRHIKALDKLNEEKKQKAIINPQK